MNKHMSKANVIQASPDNEEEEEEEREGIEGNGEGELHRRER